MTGGGTVDDTGDGGRWLTYAEFAELRGISKTSAIRMIQRRGWQRRPGNDGTARVLVPTGALNPPGRPLPRQTTPDTTPGIEVLAGAVAALEKAVTGLREQLAEAKARAERAEAGMAGERERADGLRDRLIGAQAELSLAQAAADRARAEAQAAQAAAEELREADEARKARGRLRRAWDGWRGR